MPLGTPHRYQRYYTGFQIFIKHRQFKELIYHVTRSENGNFTSATKDIYAMSVFDFYALLEQRHIYINSQNSKNEARN